MRRSEQSSRDHVTNFQNRVPLRVQPLRSFTLRLHNRLRLGRRWFDVAFIDDAEIKRLNRTFRSISKATDVLAFGWQSGSSGESTPQPASAPLAGLLGIIVISAETARRNAARENHSLRIEIQQLILHGLLHLLGCDHETDHGEMEALELSLRTELGISR
jgi:probable rRNA maturation factor